MSERGRGGGEGVRTRDHLANVRTLLAFLRAGLILAGIGFVIDKLAALEHAQASMFGLPIAIVGWLVVAAAAGRFLIQRRAIEAALFRSQVLWDLGLVGVIAGTGVLVLVWLSLN